MDINGYQTDIALILGELIEKETGDDLRPDRIIPLLVKHGVVDDWTWYNEKYGIIEELGYDSDSIMGYSDYAGEY